ncbi:MAG: thiamine phosphate synthase, partial [Rhizobium sp.]|nr:thiamine phosphate synthase [Rhizobium sp.]
MKRFDLSLYLVLDPDLSLPLGMVETARCAVAGGVTLVQLRDKNASTARMIETGRALKTALLGTGVPLIINDDVEAAIAIGADGLHVGQGDMDAQTARRLIGPDMILGLSVETEALAAAVDPTVADYVGAGPVFATATKPGHKPPVGMEGLARL